MNFKIKIICLCMCLLVLVKWTYAQSVSPITISSVQQSVSNFTSKEECVAFIQSMANSVAGQSKLHSSLSRSFSFTGGSMEETDTYTFTTYINEFSPIDWSRLDSVTFHKGKEFLYVYFKFNSNHIIETRKELDNLSGLITKIEEDKGLNYFFINIPFHLENQVARIRMAAQKLLELSQKNGPLFTARERKKIKHIDGKPSLSETLEFINKYLADGQNNDFFCNTVTFDNKEAYVGLDKNDNIILKSKYQRTGRVSVGSPKSYSDVSINFSQVEEIRVVRGEGFPGGCCQFGLWFIEKGNSASAKMHLPLWKGAESFSNSQYLDEKIYKAFNHLRQLAGAPEPLNF